MDTMAWMVAKWSAAMAEDILAFAVPCIGRTWRWREGSGKGSKWHKHTFCRGRSMSWTDQQVCGVSRYRLVEG